MRTDMTLSDLHANYVIDNELSPVVVKKYRAHLRFFEEWLGRPATLGELADKTNEYVSQLGGSPHTILKKRTVLRAFLRYAADNLWISMPKIRKVKVPEHIPRALTKKEFRQLLMHAGKTQRAAILLAYDTGLRHSDLFRATWNDLHRKIYKPFKFKDKIVYYRLIIIQHKTGTKIECRVRVSTVKALEAVRREGNPRLLPFSGGARSWKERWNKLKLRSGIPCPGLQMIRRTGASHAAKNGLNVQAYLGHKGGATATRYYIDPRIAPSCGPLPPALSKADEREEEYELASQKAIRANSRTP